MYINDQHKKADQFLDQQKYDKALIAFDLSLKINPNHPDLLSQRGVVHIHLNNKKEAIDDFNLALELEPNNSYRYASRAYAKDFFGDLDGAIEDYQMAVKIDPEDAIAHNNLGLLLEKQGYQSKAKENFDKADLLAKHQENFLQKLDELEQNKPAEQSDEHVNKPKNGVKLQPKKMESDKPLTKTDIIKNVFTKKSQFKEFISFVKNGFKIKNDD